MMNWQLNCAFIYKTVGACLSAFDSWLVIRGIKTLALRMEQHQKNAIALAEWLKQEPEGNKGIIPWTSRTSRL